MYASIEYMLAGLPIVSTPSRGGRDVFFDPDYCVVVEPNARAVREAVDALRARNIPREYVRARTLAKLEPERRRFLEFFEGIKERYGVPRSYTTVWPFPGSPFHNWTTVREHARQLFESPNPAERSKRVAAGPTTELTAYSLHSFAPRLAPARAQRDWMDRLPAQQAYHCLPMAIANAYGWNVLCPVPIEIEWNGGPMVHDSDHARLEAAARRRADPLFLLIPFRLRHRHDAARLHLPHRSRAGTSLRPAPSIVRRTMPIR